MRFTGSQDGIFPLVCRDLGSAIGGAAQAAGSVAAAGIQAQAATQAAQMQQQSQQKAAAALQAAGTKAQTYLQPYDTSGTNQYNALNQNAATYTAIPTQLTGGAETEAEEGINADHASQNILSTLANGPTQAQLAATPGYQFEQTQGQESVNNAAAARGLASSGAALKGADAYANNLASTNYQNNYQDMLGAAQGYQTLGSNYGQQSNNLLAVNQANQGNVQQSFGDQNTLAGYGLNAAGTSVNTALSAAGGAAAYTAGAGTAGASGAVGTANALSSGLQNVGNTYSQYQAYQNLLNGGASSGNNSSDAFAGAGEDIGAASLFGA